MAVGELLNSTGRRHLEIRSPFDGSPVGSLPVATEREVADALVAARRAFPGWARTPAAERGAALHAAATALRERADDLAEVNRAETGKPADDARGGVLAGASTLDQYAELGPLRGGRTLLGDRGATDFAVPEPRGVVVVLSPWNDPVAVACGLLGAALVTGNTAVHKPSERCPRTGQLLHEVLAPHVPDDVLRHLVGDAPVGEALCASGDVDLVAHVGSTAAGRAVAARAAATGAKVLLENGGNDALIVDAGVDPLWAAEQAALGAFANAGQICTSVERIYVHRAVAEDVTRALVELAGRWSQPLVDRRHREHVHSHVADAVDHGARVLTGGAVPDGPGSHYPATVLAGCTPTMLVLREETFGPVAPIRVVPDFAAGLAEACADEYGLAATVLTDSTAHAQEAWRALPVGTVKINAVFGGAPGGAAQPRRASGSGYGYGPELLDEMTTTKVVHWEPPCP
ncbi:aldehyde dehydrogenase family protein [Umezawaea beigongshangensis]|uniref:aldehyde dehydrogenase family protein n=1 Tax=Umezawaea beigongshangensis TaxID=2780383 RepID=UPI0027DE4DB2|nr:aldehyde dehydrogenase family protein [Umezawaea beigongshangensis]